MSALAFSLISSVDKTELEAADEMWAALDDDIWRVGLHSSLSYWLRSYASMTATLNLYALVTSVGIMLLITNLPQKAVDGDEGSGEFSLHHFDVLLATIYGALDARRFCPSCR
jgi:hypothetical protein